jgi:MFS family permease
VLVITIGGLCGVPSVAVNSVYGAMILLWIQFFCGGFTMPVLTGILLNMIPPSLRTLAYSIANLIYNLFGYLPAPFVYGYVYESTGGGQSRWGYFSIQVSCFLTSGMLVVGLII